ncbi:MAG: PLD nuclease N-terminal domain-containing protein [Chloroflexi bacterium]|nr:PLD nuclease N-terminal domain-containing protein [Chloroflexota bacterium]
MSTQSIILLAPVAIIQLTLLVVALRDLIRRREVTGGNKWIWVAVIFFAGIAGPLLYLFVGRKEE